MLWVALVPTPRSCGRSSSRGTGWNSPAQSASRACSGNLRAVTDGRAEVKKPFSSPGSLSPLAGLGAWGGGHSPCGHSEAEEMFWGCAGTSSHPQALVRPNWEQQRQPHAADLWCLSMPSARSGTLGRAYCSSRSSRTTTPANPSFARNLSVSRGLNIRADEEPRCPLWARAESKKRKQHDLETGDKEENH